ncbi:MAG: glycosyltransferase family 4 protein [Flavobacteriales bacterium]|nr:glycosyltransferase family 4 protein [Flavobacteriales bacterium]
MPKVLFIASHRPHRSPGQRFRFEQYFGFLAEHGFQYEVSFLVEPGDDQFLYKPGHFTKKMRFVRRCIAKRRLDVARMNDFDIIFISREALMTRSTWFERAFRNGRAKIIYDFDDSVWLSNVSEANRRWGWVKDASKTSKLIALADLVFAGNNYLAEYARKYNERVQVVATTIDTDEYLPRTERPEGPVVIGWSGSITTIRHFKYAVPALLKLKAKYGDRIAFRVVGDGNFHHAELGITGLPWRKESELDDLRAMDIGIMPLPDDEWARGKCGLKGLQYMALGIPTLMSPVGVNTEIIQHGVNGFLPASEVEWVDQISRLVEDADLRARLGAEARRTVEERYSVKAWQGTYLKLFNSLLGIKQAIPA